MKNWKLFNFYGNRVADRTARFFSMILMMLTLCVGNAWSTTTTRYPASDVDDTNWKALGSGAPTIGEQYYILWNDTNRVHDSKKDHDDLYISKHFLTTPTTSYDKVKSSGANTQNGEVSTSNWRYQFVTRYAAQAILFTLEAVPNETGKFYLKYGENNYVTDQWGKSSGTPTSAWNGSSNKLKFEYDSNKKGLKCTIGTSTKYFGAFVSSTVLNGQLQQLSATSPFVPVTFISKTVYDENTSVESHTVTYSMAIVNESGSAVSIGQGVTIAYHAESDDEDNDNYSFNFVFQLGKAAEAYSTKETEHITLSIPHKTTPNDAYLDLPRGYNFLGWYKSTGSSTAVVSPSSSYVATFDNNYNIGARIEKKTKRSVTFASPNGTCSLIGVADKYKNAVTVSDVLSGNTLSVYKDDTLTLTATPDTQNGYYMYGWYYRVGSSTTREPLTPISTSTVGNVTTAKICVPTNASYVGADFRKRKEFKIAPYNAGFTNSDYTLSKPATFKEASATLSPATTDTLSYYLYEGESVDFKFVYSTTTTRGVQYNRWYYKKGGTGTEYGVTTNVDYHLTYNTLVNNISGIPVFAVDVERKDTLTVKYVSSPYGAYTSMFCDSNGGTNHGAGYPHPDLSGAGGKFTISAGNTETTKQLYADDMIRLLRTSSQHDSTANGYVFQTWYWEDAEGFQYPLGEGRDSTSISVGIWKQYLETFLPEGAVKVGAHIVEAQPRPVRFMANSKGTYHVKATTYTGTAISSENFDMTTSTNRDVTNWLPSGYITLSNPTCNDPEHYVFYRWYYVDQQGIKKTIAYLKETVSAAVPDADSIGVEFQPIANFTVSGLYFDGLADAIQAAQAEVNKSGSATIVVARDATVTAGNYTIPKNVTLLIPYKDGQSTSLDLQPITNAADPVGAYHTLTLKKGAHLEVYGTIDVSGNQTTGGGNGKGYMSPSRTAGPYYGMMDMKGGSSITLNSGAHLYAYGYVIGDRDANGRYTCEIDVRRGATVHEHFQITDWKGAFPTVKICNYESTKKVLPISQYFIQNVEVPARYRPGSRLLGAASINVNILDHDGDGVGITFAMSDAGIVGIKYNDNSHVSDNAVFLLNNEDESEDTWVRKFYDPATDQQVFEINNSADVGSLVMKVKIPGIGQVTGGTDDEINVDSRFYQLPIMNNFKMHLLSGNMYITQMTEMLPGSVIEIDKQSTMTINAPSVVSNRTLTPSLLFYDADQWGAFIYKNTVETVKNFTYGSRVKYRPDSVPMVRDISTKTSQGDAKLIVHGTVDVKGLLMTTGSGASITSTIEDAGTVMFSAAAPATVGSTYQISSISGDNPTFTTINRIPALLQNGAGCTYGATTPTASTAANQSFCFIDKNKDGIGEWVIMVDDGCFVKETVGNVTTYYAKPQEYVALANGKTENEDHTYSDAAGAGRLFILMDDCQWWEVENVDNLYHCIHPDNDTYYFYDVDRLVQEGKKLVPSPAWVEKKFAISWKNWDGSALRDGDKELRPYELTYGTQPKFLHTNPTRPDDVDYTYNFIGWTPTPVPVTGDATYTAVYEKIQKKYTIIFQDQSGNEISRQQLALGESPTPPDVSAIENSYWNPSIAVVSGNATYQVAVYDKAPTKFTVTWANYDGSTIYTEQVANGNAPVYDSTHEVVENVAVGEPTKNLNNEYNYTWTGWKSAAGTYSTEAALPEVNANITYTATFSSAEKTYAIRFYQEDGNTQIGETQNLVFGATPVVPEYNKPSTAEYTYVTEWVDIYDTLAVSVRTVTGDADYQANFVGTKNRYTLKLQSNNNDVCAFTGAGVYDYGTANIAVAASIASGYEFVRWEGVDWTAASGTIEELTGDMTLTLYVQPTAGVSNLEVAPESEENITSATQCNDFVLTSNGTYSGQVTGAEKIELFGDAYYDLVLDGPQDRTWYSVAVPWQVDATSGIWAKNGTSARRLVLGSDFDIIYYNGDCRAAGGTQCWDYLEDQSSKIMMPGKAYMIAFRSAPQTIRFQKVSRAAILNTQTSVEMYPSAETSKANWNGIANPALYYAYINAGSENGIGYIYRAGRPGSPENRYESFEMDDNKLIVGQPIYVQAETAKSIVANTSAYSNAAPRRDKMAAKETRYKVDIMREGKQNDRIYLQTDDEKEDMYIIGQDLAKMGVSSKVAQMWIDRYNSKLCLNTIASVDEVATYPLGISAPQAGEYTIELISQPNDDSDLYLTLDGQAIWNLSDGAYTAYLEKGTTNRYGLRISVKKTPTVATGMDEAVVNAKGETKKVLVNGQVFVVRGEKVYSIDGRMVK